MRGDSNCAAVETSDTLKISSCSKPHSTIGFLSNRDFSISIAESGLNPKKDKSDIHQQSSMATRTITASLKTSILDDAWTQIANGDGVGLKNGLHNGHITNASELGKGLPRVEYRDSDRRSRSTLADAAMLCRTTADYSASGNLG